MILLRISIKKVYRIEQYFFLLLFIVSVGSSQAQSFQQLGNDIEGSEAGELLGSSTSLNKDGTVVIIGAPRHDNSRGRVSVFQLINGDWQQLGQTMYGDAEEDHFGHAVDINASGTKIIVGAPLNSANALQSGLVKTYEYNSDTSNWDITGTISGPSFFDSLGKSVSISDDGSRIAIGAFRGTHPGGPVSLSLPGYVAVYESISDDWSLMTYKSGISDFEGFGYSVSLSGDGNRLAVGAPGFIGGPPLNTPGRVETFEYVNNSWNSLGSIDENFLNIYPIEIGDQFGASVDLNYNGNFLIVGAPEFGIDSSLGLIHMFLLSNNEWIIAGGINGEFIDEEMGSSVSMSDDGLKVVTGTNIGTAKAYEYISNVWTQVGSTITSEEIGESLITVSTSGGGGIISLGSYSHGGSSGANSGQVQLFNKNPDASSIGIITKNATEITANSVVLGGIIIADGFETITERGVIYTTNTGSLLEIFNFEINDEGVIRQSSSQVANNFSDSINNLTELSTYSYRAYVIDDQGTVRYGDILQFTTSELSVLSLGPRVLLQGPYDIASDLMNDDLRANNLIPTTSPYADALTADESVFSAGGNPIDDIVDWVYVELRDKNDISNVLYARSALLSRVGFVVAEDKSTFKIPGNPDDYYVSISHRNHIAIVTDSPVTISETAVGIDFSGDLNFVRGNGNALVELESGVYGMIAGDTTQNSSVETTDLTSILSLVGQFGYNINDVNLNGDVQVTDITTALAMIGRAIQF